MRGLVLRLLAAITTLLLAACGTTDDPTVKTPSGSTGSTDSTADAAASTTGTSALDGASTAPVSDPGSANEVALLSDVRAGRHSGFDRIVFEFENDAPGYKVAYIDPPITEDGSGDEVAVRGDAFLEIRMEPASGADLSGAELRTTYDGPRRLTPATEAVEELVRTGDFEAVLTWVAGVDDRRLFKVMVLNEPPRVVVDIAHSR